MGAQTAATLDRKDIRAELRYAKSGFKHSLKPQFRPGIDDAWVWTTQKSKPSDAFKAGRE
jgi:hypothetical protein